MQSGPLTRPPARFLSVLFLTVVSVLSAADPPASPKQKSDAPQVISREKFDAQQKRNSSPSKSGNTRPSSHLSTSFYGIRAEGDSFVFVIDNSTSMLDGGRLASAHSALNAAIRQFRFPQKFYILAFDAETLAVPWGPFISAQSADARKVPGWLARLTQKDGTLPGPALRQAIGLDPSAVFFLTDGQFDDPDPAQIRQWNSRGVPIHVIDLGPAGPDAVLQQIARDSGGIYRKGR
jgi:Mg-chelatase subunit ChlD